MRAVGHVSDTIITEEIVIVWFNSSSGTKKKLRKRLQGGV